MFDHQEIYVDLWVLLNFVGFGWHWIYQAVGFRIAQGIPQTNRGAAHCGGRLLAWNPAQMNIEIEQNL